MKTTSPTSSAMTVMKSLASVATGVPEPVTQHLFGDEVDIGRVLWAVELQAWCDLHVGEGRKIGIIPLGTRNPAH